MSRRRTNTSDSARTSSNCHRNKHLLLYHLYQCVLKLHQLHLRRHHLAQLRCQDRRHHRSFRPSSSQTMEVSDPQDHYQLTFIRAHMMTVLMRRELQHHLVKSGGGKRESIVVAVMEIAALLTRKVVTIV